MPSFQGIKSDCESILTEIKAELRCQFENSNASAKQLTESVDLLLQLDEPAKELCTEFLSCAEKRLGEQLVMLRDQSEHRDISEFINLGCSGFLSDLSLVVASFHDMFINRRNFDNIDNRYVFIIHLLIGQLLIFYLVFFSEIFENFASLELNSFIVQKMQNYFELIQNKIDMEQDVGDTSVLVQALDRFYRRLQAMNALCSDTDFAKYAV